MAFFSWVTSDTNKSISNIHSVKGTFPVYVLCPDGKKIREDSYEGHGIFGGHDIYALVAKWNIPNKCKDVKGHWLSDEEIRCYGLGLSFSNKHIKYRIKIVENKNLNYYDVAPSKDCPYRGFFY